MKEKIKTRKGFIKIPILIIIIALVVIVSLGAGVVLHKQGKLASFITKVSQIFTENKDTGLLEKTEQEKISQQEQELQQAELVAEQAKAEAERLKTEQEAQRITELEQRIKELEEAPSTIIKEINPTDTEGQGISAQEIDPYLTGVVKISCKDQEGSGMLWQIGTDYYVLTNSHVVSNPYPLGQCNVVVHEKTSSNGVGIYEIYPSAGKRWNSYTDISLLEIDECDIEGISSLPIRNLNYAISSLHQCFSQTSLGSPVIIVGYPAFSMSSVEYQGEKFGEQTVRTITNGIISSYDSSETQPFGSLPYPDYFVSAKIDSGNSGGLALSRDSNGLCFLGIPTWLSLGVYETQGIVQNINNIMSTK